MYFSLSTIAFYAALISQTVVVSSAPVLTQTGDVTSHLRLRNLAVPKPLHRRQEAAPNAASIASVASVASAASVAVPSAASVTSAASVAVPAASGAAGANGAGANRAGVNATSTNGANAGSGPKFVIYTDKRVSSPNGLPVPSDIQVCDFSRQDPHIFTFVLLRAILTCM